MKVLELFSGIGGMHYALKETGLDVEITAVEINTLANYVYKHNFPESLLLQRNIQSFSAEDINRISPEMIIMSPPCQPFTRVGLKKDISDERCSALSHIISILPQMNNTLCYILVENVKGFEVSLARDKLVLCLSELRFDYREFLLSPVQFGIPNARLRYYLIAKRKFLKVFRPIRIAESISENILQKLNQIHELTIEDILNSDKESYKENLIPDKILFKYGSIFDIVTKDSPKTCCFTKAYGHYVEGTGSVFCPFSQDYIKSVFKEYKNCSNPTLLKSLNLRYFTPDEIAKLMCFPPEFNFPNDVTCKQKYRLLGNSVNVKVVALLLRILMCDEML
uniref:tRNA (cytosine(38)-C(5))-methyltransferase n=1 Tax=Clastoptera arizonana TaxID=38151 RepID=A0A1B6DC09_9HEMI